MATLWIVSLPNNKEKSSACFRTLSTQFQSQCDLYSFSIPNLVVGTLDTLIALSDDLSKTCTQIENVVRKIERQYIEIAGEKPQSLRINEVAVSKYFEKFQWDFAQFQCDGKQLSEIVAQIQNIAAKNDEELKILSNSYTEKNLALAAAKRRQTVNLSSSEFEDFLQPEMIAKLDIQNSDSLLTVMVVVPKAFEQEFLNTYSGLGSEIAAFGGPDWTNSNSIGSNDGKFGPKSKRTSVKGCPVVPGSKKKVIEEGDYVMYAITILRGHYEAGYFVDDVFTAGIEMCGNLFTHLNKQLIGSFVDYLEPLKQAFREKRFIIRELTYDSAKAGGVDSVIEQVQNELKQAKATTLRWCKAHFGEVYGGFVHLKVIQAFVESVLRYGLPADFCSLFMKPDMKREKEQRAQLCSMVLNLKPELRPKKGLADEDDEDKDNESNLPFVLLKCPIIGNNQLD